MYLEAHAESGIEFIMYYDHEQMYNDMLDLNYLNNDLDNHLPGLLIFHGMEIKGPVHMMETKAMNQSYTPGEKRTVIRIGEYAIICRMNIIAKKYFKLITAVLSNPNASQEMDEAIKIAQELFVF